MDPLAPVPLRALPLLGSEVVLMLRLTKEQAAVVGAYTGIALGPFGDIHEYVEKVLERPVMTHEFAYPDIWEEIKAAAKEDLMAVCHDPKDAQP